MKLSKALARTVRDIMVGVVLIVIAILVVSGVLALCGVLTMEFVAMCLLTLFICVCLISLGMLVQFHMGLLP